MRILIFTIFIANIFCFFLSQECLNISAYAYDEEDILEEKRDDINQNRLFARKEKTNSEFIREKDIIDIDEFVEKQPEKKIPEKASVDKVKKGSYSYELALEYVEKGKKYEARNMLSDLYFAETDSEKRDKFKAELDKLNAELVFSRGPSPETVFYTVKPGDTLAKIASKFNTTYESIMRINNKGRSIIKVGEWLKVLKGEITLLVDKSDFTLTMLLNGYFIKQYPVGIGMYNKTPEGIFLVKDKLTNPVWYSPEGVYEYGDPKNLLGTRWIGFDETEEFYGYGIHGTTEPETIGKAMSNGCIRLLNKDVEELYDFVKTETKVIIQN